MATLALSSSVFSPRSGRFAFIPHSGPAEFFSDYLYGDGPLLDDSTLTYEDTLSAVSAVSEVSTETLVFEELLLGVFLASLADTWTFSDILDGELGATVSDALTFSDTLAVPVVVGGLTDIIGWSDTPGAASAVTERLTDVVYFSDGLKGHLEGQTAEALSWADSLFAVENPGDLQDSWLLTDTLNGVSANSAVSTEGVVVQDTLDGVFFGALLSESLSFADTLTSVQIGYGVSVETVSWGEALIGSLTLYGTSQDTLQTSDEILGSLALQTAGHDILTFSDLLNIDPTQRILAVNAETGAVSTYQIPVNITGVASWNNVLYLTTDDGLYALDADDDDGTAITWSLRSGFSNLGTDLLKRVMDVNVLAKGDGAVVVSLVADRYGQKEERRYQLVKLTADALRDQVVKTGQGIQSVYWQVGVTGSGPAEIDELRVRATSLSRRR